MKLIRPTISCYYFIFLSFITSQAQPLSPAKQINFDADWKFHFGNASNPEKDFNYSIANIFSKSGNAGGTAIDPNFNDKDWKTLNLPHDWLAELPFVNVKNSDVMSHGYKPAGGLFPETSIGWYRKHFKIAKSDSGLRHRIRFDGVFRNASFWINGFYLGNNQSGYTGVSYDISNYLNYEKENVLVVRVDATQYEGWFYEGAGIYRHTWLNTYNNIHIAEDGIFIYTNVQGKNGEVNIEVTVENQNSSPGKVIVNVYVADRSGNIIGKAPAQPVSLGNNESKTIKQKISVTGPVLWSLENPYLYRVVADVRSSGQIIDSRKVRFGIRTIDISSKGLFINGKYVKVHGVCNHQDHAGVGSALPDYLQYYRIRLLKDMGANAYRSSHNPPTPELLDACDSLGMLVLDENRLLNSSPEYLDQFEKLIKRDRNRACVFLWSIGNEEGWVQTTPVGKKIAEVLLEKQKELDPTRLSTYGADVPNVYKGINEVIPVRGFNYNLSGIADYHKAHPDQPIIGTEVGSTVTTRGIYVRDSVHAYLPDHDITAPPWASTAETWWKLFATEDWLIGGFVWTGFDYRGEPTPYQWPNINSHFGIMDICGFPKNIYYYYQSWWTNKDVLHISPDWNLAAGKADWRIKTGQPVDIWVNSNADNVELFLNGKSLGKKDMPRNGHLQWSVHYEPGTLEAVAFKKGKKITSFVETTGVPAEVVLTPYKTTMLADGEDASVINISVMDEKGREVPDANNMIRFTIKGPGKIIGVGNGDPSSHEPDKCANGAWQRSLFNGKCQVIIQATTEPGTIYFEAQAAGLWKGSTDIVTVSPGNISVITSNNKYQLAGESAQPREATKMLGADISFLPELEDRGMQFYDKGVPKDAIQILKDHGFNYIRLRVFNDPARDSGYSPKKARPDGRTDGGFCDPAHTKAMAKRIKAAGMKLLLDFHYSDYWADPGKQYKPAAWRNLSFEELQKALYDYTEKVIRELKDQGTAPDMVQVGNEINHGIVWPEGNVMHPDSLAQLLSAGIAAIKAVDPSIVIMLHIALGGQNDESVFFLDQMIERKVHFDVIGLSYYPRWHGSPDDLRNNLLDLTRRYHQDIIVAEYSQLKNEVNEIVFNLPGGKGKGTCIWEPLNSWESVFDKDGNSNEYLNLYDGISQEYLNNNQRSQ